MGAATARPAATADDNAARSPVDDVARLGVATVRLAVRPDWSKEEGSFFVLVVNPLNSLPGFRNGFKLLPLGLGTHRLDGLLLVGTPVLASSYAISSVSDES